MTYRAVEAGMPQVARMVAVSALLAATAGCSLARDTPDECSPGRSTLSGVDPSSGEITWQAALDQASDTPVTAGGGVVVVTAPCGAAVVDLVDGNVRFDEATPGAAVGVAGDRLVALDDPAGDRSGIRALPLEDGTSGWSFSTNSPYQDAVVADGRLVTLYGNQLEAYDPTDMESSWRLQIPAFRGARLVRSEHLMLVTADDGSTFAVDLADGTLAWRTVPPVAATGYSVRVTSVPGTVLTAASTQDEVPRSFVYATGAESGRLRWTRTALSVLAADREITVLRTEQDVEAVDTGTGALLWRHPVGSVGHYADALPAALTRDTVVVPEPGSAALALDRSSGRQRWVGPGEASTVVAAGQVVMALTDDAVVAFDALTGAELWSRTAERDGLQLAVSDGQLLLLDSDSIPQPMGE